MAEGIAPAPFVKRARAVEGVVRGKRREAVVAASERWTGARSGVAAVITGDR